MIKTILYIATMLLCLATAYFGIDMRGKYAAQKEQFQKAKTEKTNFIRNNDEVSEELEETNEQLALVRKKGSELEAGLESGKSDQGTVERSLAKVDAEIEEYDDKINEVGRLITQVRQMFPDGDIAEIPGIISDLEEEIKQGEKKLDEEMLVNDKLSKVVSRNKDEVNRLDQKVATIRKRIRNNALEARISSVDNRWGFCVINGIGSKNGITGETSLLVKRGERLIGRLRISSLEPNQIIADLDRRSMARGVRLSAGDRVILETPVAN